LIETVHMFTSYPKVESTQSSEEGNLHNLHNHPSSFGDSEVEDFDDFVDEITLHGPQTLHTTGPCGKFQAIHQCARSNSCGECSDFGNQRCCDSDNFLYYWTGNGDDLGVDGTDDGHCSTGDWSKDGDDLGMNWSDDSDSFGGGSGGQSGDFGENFGGQFGGQMDNFLRQMGDWGQQVGHWCCNFSNGTLDSMNKSSEDNCQMCLWFGSCSVVVSVVNWFGVVYGFGVVNGFWVVWNDNLGVNDLGVNDFVVNGFVVCCGVVYCFVVNFVRGCLVVNGCVVYWCNFLVYCWYNHSFVVSNYLLRGDMWCWFHHDCLLVCDNFVGWLFHNWLMDDWLVNDGLVDSYDWLVDNWLVDNWLVNNWLVDNWLVYDWLMYDCLVYSDNWFFHNWLMCDWLVYNWLMYDCLMDSWLMDSDNRLLDNSGFCDNLFGDDWLVDNWLVDNCLMYDWLMNDCLVYSYDWFFHNWLMDDGFVDSWLMDYWLMDNWLVDYWLMDDGFVDSWLMDDCFVCCDFDDWLVYGDNWFFDNSGFCDNFLGHNGFRVGLLLVENMLQNFLHLLRGFLSCMFDCLHNFLHWFRDFVDNRVCLVCSLVRHVVYHWCFDGLRDNNCFLHHFRGCWFDMNVVGFVRHFFRRGGGCFLHALGGFFDHFDHLSHESWFPDSQFLSDHLGVGFLQDDFFVDNNFGCGDFFVHDHFGCGNFFVHDHFWGRYFFVHDHFWCDHFNLRNNFNVFFRNSRRVIHFFVVHHFSIVGHDLFVTENLRLVTDCCRLVVGECERCDGQRHEHQVNEPHLVESFPVNPW